MTQNNQNTTDQEGVLRPKESLHTGVLETEGSGLHHSNDKFGSPPEAGATPTDVSQANPFAEAPTAGVSDDGGDGMNTTGMQYEYPDGKLIEPEEG